MTTTLCDLPNELLTEICKYLDYNEIKKCIRLTCRRLCDLTKGFYTSCRNGQLAEALFLDNPEILRLSGCDAHHYSMILKHCPDWYSEKRPGVRRDLQVPIFELHTCFDILRLRHGRLRIPDDIPPFNVEDVGFVNLCGEFTPLMSTDVAKENATRPPVESLEFGFNGPLITCVTPATQHVTVRSEHPGRGVTVLNMIEMIAKTVTGLLEARSPEDMNAFNPSHLGTQLQDFEKYNIPPLGENKDIRSFTFKDHWILKRTTSIRTWQMKGGPRSGDGVIRAKVTIVLDLDCDFEFQIMNGLTKDFEGYTIEDAVDQLVEITVGYSIQATVKEDERILGNHLYYTACYLLEVAASNPPSRHTKLVAFMQLLQKSTVIDQATDKPMLDDGDVVWKDLPNFWYTFADELGAFNPFAFILTDNEARRWENTSSFFARCTATSNTTDFTNWALTAFYWAFGPWDDDRTETTELAVRSACIWFMMATDRIWEKVCDEKFERFNREKWDRWRQSLIDIQERFRDNMETNKWIDDSLREIRRVDGTDSSPVVDT